MDKEAWQATVHEVTESDTTEAILAETSSSYSTLNKGFSSYYTTLDSRDVT